MDDVDRFDRLWRGAEGSVVRVIKRHAATSERDDLLIETRVLAWRGFGRLEPNDEEKAFGSLSCKIAHRLCQDRVRRSPGGKRATNRPKVSPLCPSEPDRAPSPFDAAVSSIRFSSLIERIAQLPERSRKALILSARGETYREIAETCGMSETRAYQICEATRASLLQATS